MGTENERNWTAHLVISCEHAGLKPYFKALEAEVYRVLAHVDDSRQVCNYIADLIHASKTWGHYNGITPTHK